jgi:hypothetical protein
MYCYVLCATATLQTRRSEWHSKGDYYMTHVKTATDNTRKGLLEAAAVCYDRANMTITASEVRAQLAVHALHESVSAGAATSTTAGMISSIYCIIITLIIVKSYVYESCASCLTAAL